MQINWMQKEINLKIVYYGPAYSGKTSNLEWVHQRTPAERRTQMLSLKTRGDRTLFFDYMQMELPPIYGLRPKFNLYTVPGQVEYTATRRLVLQGVDGIIFVADSQNQRMQENRDSLVDLYRQLKEIGISAGAVSLVMQFNKRDLPNAMPVEEIRKAFGLHNYALPCFEATASSGEGVFSTLKASINSVIGRLETAASAA